MFCFWIARNGNELEPVQYTSGNEHLLRRDSVHKEFIRCKPCHQLTLAMPAPQCICLSARYRRADLYDYSQTALVLPTLPIANTSVSCRVTHWAALRRDANYSPDRTHTRSPYQLMNLSMAPWHCGYRCLCCCCCWSRFKARCASVAVAAVGRSSDASGSGRHSRPSVVVYQPLYRTHSPPRGQECYMWQITWRFADAALWKTLTARRSPHAKTLKLGEQQQCLYEGNLSSFKRFTVDR